MKATMVKTGKWIVWAKLDPGMIKINTDGSKRGEKTTGGGVVRNESGHFVVDFSMTLDHQDILRAELEAILEGTMVCILSWKQIVA